MDRQLALNGAAFQAVRIESEVNFAPRVRRDLDLSDPTTEVLAGSCPSFITEVAERFRR